MKFTNTFTCLSAYSVVEGVCFKARRFLAVVLRLEDQRLLVRSVSVHVPPWLEPFRKLPLVRGMFYLLETVFIGIDQLSYSAQSASVDSKKGKIALSPIAVVFSILFAFLAGLLLFVVFPRLLTEFWLGDDSALKDSSQIAFHLLNGGLRIFCLLIYLLLISMLKGVRGIFRYHSACHEALNAFENESDLSISSCAQSSSVHPRCGMGFLISLIFFSIVFFSILFPVFGWTSVIENYFANQVVFVGIKIFLLLILAGVLYEFLVFCSNRLHLGVVRILYGPFFLMQRLVLRGSTDAHREVALASLRQVLRLEKGVRSPAPDGATEGEVDEEFVISKLDELGSVQAKSQEFRGD